MPNLIRRVMLSAFNRHRTPIDNRPNAHLRRELRLEALEDRTVPAAPAVYEVYAIDAANGTNSGKVFVNGVDAKLTSANNYTILNDVFEALADGDTVVLRGNFNWASGAANTSWQAGSDGVVGTNDDYGIFVQPDVNNVTITAPAPVGTTYGATITGPGDVTTVDSEGFLYFDGDGPNQNWTISNLSLANFDVAIGMYNTTGLADAFSGTTITNNKIVVPADVANASTSSAEYASGNVGILLGFGAGQTVSGNSITLAGTGTSTGTASNPTDYAQSVGILTQTGVDNSYDGLTISGNTIQITGAPAANPEILIGVWENGHADSSTITVVGNTFQNIGGGTGAPNKYSRGFRITSHSGAGSTVLYEGNTVSRANIGFQWLSQGNFSTGLPVELVDNIVTGSTTGVLIDSSGAAYLKGNSITNGGTGSVGVSVVNGGRLVGLGDATPAVEGNVIRGSTAGITVAASAGVIGAISDNNLAGSPTGKALVNSTATGINAQGNWWGSTVQATVTAQHTGPVDDSNFIVVTPPVISNFTIPTLTVGVPMTPITVTASGSPAPTLSATGLPDGLMLVDNGNGTATLSGTPLTGTGGAHGTATNNPVVIEAAIGFLAGVPLTVASFNVNEAPSFVSDSDATFVVGQFNSFQVQASGFPNPAFTRTGSALPAGVTFNATTGVLSGTPTALPAGPITFTFTATNAAGATPQVFTLTVKSAPVVGAFAIPALTEGVPMAPVTVRLTGDPAPLDGDIAGALPAGLSLTPGTDAAGRFVTISGTPDAGTAGPGRTVTVTASNEYGTGTRTSAAFTINGPPAFVNGPTDGTTFVVGRSVGTTTGASPTAFRVLTTGFPAPQLRMNGLTGTALATGVPGVTFNTTTGFFSGTPTAIPAAPVTLTFTATSAAGSAVPQVFTLTVKSAPAVGAFAIPALTEGVPMAPVTVRLTGDPAPLDGDIAGALPAGLSLTPGTDAAGRFVTISGTPDAGTAGPGRTVTVTASNEYGTGTRTSAAFTINGPPAFTSANNLTIPAGTAATTSAAAFTLTATGFPAPTYYLNGQTGTAVPTGVPGLTFNTTTRKFSGTPLAAGSARVYELTFTAINAGGATPPQTFTLTVTGAAAIPAFTLPTLTVGTPMADLDVPLFGAPAPALDAIGGTLPDGLFVTPMTDALGNAFARISGTPADDTAGSGRTVTLTVGAVSRASAAFTINAEPTITSEDSLTLPTGVNASTSAASFTLTATGFPNPTVSVLDPNAVPTPTFKTGTSVPTGVPGLTFNTTTRKFVGTPTTAGTYTITFRATNGVGAPAEQTFTLTVDASPVVTKLTLPNWTVGRAYGQTVTAIGGTGAKTFSVSAGALPDGLSLNPTTGAISGTPTVTGDFNFTVTATDASSAAGEQTYDVTINAAPDITTTVLSNGTRNAAGYNQAVAVDGGTGPYTFTRTGTLPNGLSFNATTGVLSGTPTAVGTFNFTITARDAAGATDSQAYTVVISAAMVFGFQATPGGSISTALPPGTVNVGYDRTITVTGGTGAKTFELIVKASPLQNLPPGLSLDTNTGEITGTPTTAGTYNFDVRVTDSVGASVLRTLRIVITA